MIEVPAWLFTAMTVYMILSLPIIMILVHSFENLKKQIEDLLASYNDLYSAYIEESEISNEDMISVLDSVKKTSCKSGRKE